MEKRKGEKDKKVEKIKKVRWRCSFSNGALGVFVIG
jgi:hypothetical protein